MNKLTAVAFVVGLVLFTIGIRGFMEDQTTTLALTTSTMSEPLPVIEPVLEVATSTSAPPVTMPPVTVAVATTIQRKIVPTTVRHTHPAPKPRAVVPRSGPSDSVWERLAQCESGGDWNIRGRLYSGGVQFAHSTWRAMGGRGVAADASKEEQIARAKILQARSGWGQWPGCSRKLGLR